jgi:hypothetical protein
MNRLIKLCAAVAFVTVVVVATVFIIDWSPLLVGRGHDYGEEWREPLEDHWNAYVAQPLPSSVSGRGMYRSDDLATRWFLIEGDAEAIRHIKLTLQDHADKVSFVRKGSETDKQLGVLVPNLLRKPPRWWPFREGRALTLYRFGFESAPSSRFQSMWVYEGADIIGVVLIG